MLRYKINLCVLCFLAITGCRLTENTSSLSTPPLLQKTNVPVTLPSPIITTPTMDSRTTVPTPLHNRTSEIEFPFTLIGQTGGEMQVISVHDNYVYMSVGPRIVILDIVDPARPVVVDQSGILPGPFQFIIWPEPNIEIVGDYAYAISFNGLFIFDMNNFSAPELVGTFKEGYFDTGVVDDNLAYLVGKQLGPVGQEGFYIVDISDPYNPSQVSFIPLSGILEDNIFIEGGNAYVTSFASGTYIINISEPTAPIQVGHYPAYAHHIDVHNHIAYIASKYENKKHLLTDGVRIVDVSNPVKLIELAIIETSNDVEDIEIVGDHLYVVTIDDLSIINITDPTNPKLEGVFDTTTFGNGILSVAVQNGYAFLTHIRGLLQIVNVADPANPYQVGYWGAPIYAEQVTVHDNYAYVRSRGLLYFIDITDQRNPIPISFLDLLQKGVENISITDDYVYFTSNPSDSETGKLYVVDMSDPQNPTEVKVYKGQGYIGSITSDDFIYLMDNGLRILDMSEPANPVELFHNVDIQGALYVHEPLLYVYHAQDVQILDVTDPTNPIEVSSLPIGGIRHIEMVQNLAYMSEWGRGGNRLIYIFDMSEPTNPVEINVINLSSYNTLGWGMKVTENALYKAEAWFEMVDLKDLANPIATVFTYGEFPPLDFTSDQGTPDFTYVNDVDFKNSHLYVATSVGLMIFEEDR